jgi:hypothetical protein
MNKSKYNYASNEHALQLIKQAKSRQMIDHVGAQYMESKGVLVFAKQVGSNIALIRSSGQVEFVKPDIDRIIPTRSNFTLDGLARFARGENVSLGCAAEELAALLDRHMVFPANWQPKIVALWIVGTYMHMMFAFYGYIHATSASRRCGKSTLLEIISETGYNATPVSASPTPAFVFRDSDMNNATLIFDEAEHLAQTNNPEASYMTTLLNVGFKRGASVPRVIDASENQIKDFNAYGPKALASIKSLAGTTEDRTIKITLLRKPVSLRLPRFDSHKSAAQLAKLRDDLHIAVLRSAPDVLACYHATESLPIPVYLDDRARDILEPLFAIAQVVDKQNQNDHYTSALISASADIAKSRDGDDYEERKIRAAIKVLMEVTADGAAYLTSEKLLETFTGQGDSDLKYVKTVAQAQKLARSLGFESASHRVLGLDKPLRCYKIDRSAVTDIAERYASDETRTFDITGCNAEGEPQSPSPATDVTDVTPVTPDLGNIYSDREILQMWHENAKPYKPLLEKLKPGEILEIA